MAKWRPNQYIVEWCPSGNATAPGLPLGQLLTALNRKLEAYLDRDHQIGHSYLMNLETIPDLRFA